MTEIQLVELTPQGLELRLQHIVREEAAAGMIAASLHCLLPSHQLRTNGDMKKFLIVGYIYSDDIETVTNSYQLDKNDYHWWIKSVPPSPETRQSDYYSLYRFRTPHFVQGVISMADKCAVDFRTFTRGLPWKPGGGVYSFNGYDLTNFQAQVIVEDSLSDEIDEQNNENLVEPYVKDY